MFGRKAKEIARRFRDSEPKVDDVKVDAVDTGESFRAEKSQAPKAEAPKSKELSQADIDKMSYGEAFKHFRAKGKGTKFTYKGNKQAAYREGEEPESFKKNTAKPAPKAEAAKPASPSSAKPAAPRAAAGPTKERAATATATAATNATRSNRTSSDVATRMRQAEADWKAAKGKPTPSLRRVTAADVPNVRYNPSAFERGLNMDPSIRAITGMAKGGSVESNAMVKKEIGFMQKKGAPKSMIKHEKAEAKGMNMGGMAGYKKGGMAGCYAEGGAIKKPYVPTAADRNEKAGGDQEMENRSQTRGAGRGPMSRNAMKPKMYARGGGIESKGKGAGTMIKMASGGSVSARADGIASKGKTNCKIC
jgi:hypothetical protein